ncbi:MAG: hypothetical protein RMI56_07290 [Sulfolobales archaeon]|nr:hypothetical protein [Sulfolobales archaeon]MDW8083570.1 hypothetical protein [Sulfolobales archaeon]
MLLLLPTSSYLNILTTSSSGLCGTIGAAAGCVDLVVYSAGVVEKGGRTQGLPIEIALAVTRGSGAVFIHAEPVVDESFILFTRISALVASAIAGREFSLYNYYVFVKSPVARARGPSLSAAVGVGFTLALLGIKIGEPIAVTGILTPDGGIGPVGHLVEKVLALSTVAKKLYIPVATEVSVKIGGASLSLTELGRNLGVEVVEVSTIDEVLEDLGVEARRVTTGLVSPPSEIAVKLASYLKTASEKALGEVADVCSRDDADRLREALSLIKPPAGSSLRDVGYTASILLRAESTVWLCLIERGRASLASLASRTLERLKIAENTCYLYSKAAGFEFSRAIAYSTACLFLLDAWNVFNESLRALDLERSVRSLIESALIADLVSLSLDLMSSENFDGVERDLELHRVVLLVDYALALLDSFRSWFIDGGDHSQLDLLRRYIQIGAELSTTSFSLSLAYVLKVLSELELLIYSTQYIGSLYVDSLRARALAYAALSGSSTVSFLIEAGDSCVEADWSLYNCSSFYLRASTLGFTAIYLTSTRTPTLTENNLKWLYAVAAVVLPIAVFLLLRRVRVSFSQFQRLLHLL